MVRNSWMSEAPKDRAALISAGSRLRTPTAALIKIANNAPRKTTAIFEFDADAEPDDETAASATRVEWRLKKVTKGSSA